MKVGQTVKFANPQNAEEQAERFVVIEIRGDRALLEYITGFNGWSIKPQVVYEVSELLAV